jgi:fatty-acid desaturase
MLYFLAFNGLMLLLAVGVVAKLISVQFLTGFITALHYTIGISTPTQEQVRRAVLVWIIAMVIIVDMLFSLLRWAF